MRNSPDIDTDQSVSRQREIELHGYYALQNYWDGGFYTGGISAIADPYVTNRVYIGDAKSVGRY